ncbi:WxL domain-containing protein [Enterococcus faecalis]|uniref:WxL domain-containing protein n=1 Tax=Enterococcus faecalis TaxID=1351 RepID=UPI000CF2A029|nr:WxL domain-containing protein [Enterococcus faecalis]EGO6670067.1 WxL domain-containing protein [Enterococcus faecalis]EGO8077208.1 WxL domain-containing protein [Enterococcus faecalis]EHE8458975.1 WxL domain-containing protein [Enterococcus faecalis]EHU4980604.1 WxL domain-containing protein [Enterococcus faecalis]EJC3092717.1 WxL domain-containing protein [Enterococcus faecalis]
MKRINWQRLATIGLCSSLVINAFSGVTAIAETVMSESSPTVANSIKEATPASSARQESTESSQKTTETSQEEVTQETAKQAETKAPLETPEIKTNTTAQPAENSSENDRQTSISPRWVPNNQVIYPRITLAFTNESGQVFTDENLTLSGTYTKFGYENATSLWRSYAVNYPITSSNAEGGQYRVAVNATVPLPYDFFTDLPANYRMNIYAVEQLKIDNTLKYVDSIVAVPNSTLRMTRYSAQQTTELPQFGNHMTPFVLRTRDSVFSKSSENVFSLNTDGNEFLRILSVAPIGTPVEPVLYGFDGTATYRETLNYVVTRKQVTEKFVDANGVAITPPTGFTQNKKTPMTSNDFTFKQASTLPDTYQADGKTYKFKGWYKGKTKPNTLTTTKAPSYAVTYDGNDDLTVVYEAIQNPVTFQEGKGMSSVQVMNKAIQNPVTLPDRMYRVLFINETGGLTFADRYGFTGELVEVADGKVTPIGPVPTNNNSAVKEITIPGRVFDTERPTPLQYGVRNATFTLPKMYKTVTYQPGPNYTGTAYSIPETYRLSLRSGVKSDIDTTGWRIGLDPTTDPQKFTMSGIYWSSMPTNVRLATLLSATITGKGVEPSVYTLDENARMYLYLENRRVTENFVDTNGTKITAPSGFAQGKKTVITSDSYTFKQSGDLPDTYKVGTKTYQFKGWYKGKNKPDTLTTTKAPSYPVTYNDDDDLTVVYEEVVMKTYNLPAKDVYFGYVDEAGNLLNTAGFSVEAELGESDETESTVLGKIQGTDEVMSKLKKLSIPGKSYDFPIDKLKTYGARSVNHTIPKQYKTMSITPLATYTGDKTKYPMTKEIRKNIEAPYTVVSQADGVEAFKLTNAGTFFRTRRAFWTWDPNNTLYAMGIYSGTVGKNYNLASPEGTIYYYLENRRVTENFVDPSGAKITPPTGFTQGKQTVIDSDNFTYASTKALPDTYTTGDKSYKFKGWYKGKTKPGTLTTTKTPSYAVTYDDKDDMTAVYEEVQPTAEMTVSRLLEVIPNEASMMWIVKLKNTSEVPLTNVKLAPTAKWAAGISPPTQLAVRIGNTPNKIIPVTAEQWQAGVNLDIEIPVNGEALVTVNTAKITGEPRQLLTAEMTASGNFSAVTASNFVRIQGEDQTITPTPVEEGFISTPTFDFGKITINSSTKQYGLKKAADYYGNGTRNPYLRIKTSQPNWQLTAQLSQLTASADSLPTSTRLLLGSADVIAIENYNQVTELTNKVGVTKALTLTSNGTSTPVILNNQFTGNDVYQLDFDFANVKLEVPANQGKINEKYQGTVTWNLVTGP